MINNLSFNETGIDEDVLPIILYLYQQKVLSKLFILPLFFYFFTLCFVLHFSIFNSIVKKQIDEEISRKKFYYLLFFIFSNIYHLLYYHIYSYALTKEALFSLSIFSVIMMISLAFTIFVLKEQNTKVIFLPYKNQTQWFLVISNIYYFISIIFEIKSGAFFKTITLNCFKFILGIFVIKLFHQYPNNEIKGIVQTEFSYVELQEIKKKPIKKKPTKKSTMTNGSLLNLKLPLIGISFKTNFSILNNHGNIQNFYSSVYFSFSVVVSSTFFDSNCIIKRTIRDFIELNEKMLNEFTKDFYIHDLLKHLPNLEIDLQKIDKIEMIQQAKKNSEKYLQDILKEPGFINRDVLLFLGIDDDNIEEQFNLNRKKFEISEEKKKDFFNKYTETFNISKKEKGINKNLKISIIEGAFIKPKNEHGNLWKNDKVFMIKILLTCENASKIIDKKITDINILLFELCRLKNKIKDQDLIKSLHTFQIIKNKVQNKYEPFYLFKKECSEEFKEYLSIIEYIIQSICSNFSFYSLLKSMLINDFFSDFKDDFCNLCFFRRLSLGNADTSLNFEALLKEDLVSNVDLFGKNYMIISKDFKCKVFYEICIKITTVEQDFVEINKKFTFREIKSYIDLIRNELNIPITWPTSCFISNKTEMNVKYKKRLKYIKQYLLTISNNENYLKNPHWKRIFFYDQKFSSIVNSKNLQLRKESSSSQRQDSMLIKLTSE